MKKLEKKNIALLPTPIQTLDNLAKELGINNIYIKRDDLTGFEVGGNKVRKLEFLVADALKNNYDTLLTYGALQTNHGRQTIAVARKFGLDAVLIANCNELPSTLSGNLLLDKIMDADIRFVDTKNCKSFSEKELLKGKFAERIIEEYEQNSKKVYDIALGGSDRIGVMGYIEFVKELLIQIKEQDLKIDYIIAPRGSGGTLAGLILGKKFYNADFEIFGIDVLEYTDEMKDNFLNYCNDCASFLEMNISVESEDIKCFGDYVGNGYGVADNDTFKTIVDVAKCEGIYVDPTYTGKAMRGMIGLINSEIIEKSANVMFIHTGGLPGIFADQYSEYFNDLLLKNKLEIEEL